MPGRVTHPPGGESCHAPGGAAAGAPAAHRVGRAVEGGTLRGALPRGLGLSLEKAQTKEHQGAAAPWTPGGD